MGGCATGGGQGEGEEERVAALGRPGLALDIIILGGGRGPMGQCNCVTAAAIDIMIIEITSVNR